VPIIRYPQRASVRAYEALKMSNWVQKDAAELLAISRAAY